MQTETKNHNPKRKYLYIALLGLALVLAACFGVWQSLPNSQLNSQIKNPEELAQLVKPSVVRIIQHVTGEMTMPEFDVDMTTLAIMTSPDGPKITKKVDEYITGSGFIVNPDGYIITNSHVISDQSIKNLYIENELQTAMERKIKGIDEQGLKELFGTEENLLMFLAQAEKTIQGQSSFNLKSTVVVLNPSSKLESLMNLFNTGLPAQIVSVNPNFMDDEKDVGLIKIGVNNLPSALLGESESIAIGSQIYVAGFPSTAEINGRNALEPTFTQGLISAIKYSQSKDFKIFQTEAKISQGSSGGPLFNDKGEVVGLITYETGELNKQEGDNFAFALPISLVKAVLEKNQVTNTESQYSTHFKTGLVLLQSDQCEKAIKELEQGRTDEYFDTGKYINPYVEKCNDLIAQGKSNDNFFKLVMFRLKSLTGFVWFVIAGRFALIIIGVGLFLLAAHRLKQDEQQIRLLRQELAEEEQRDQSLLEQLAKKGVNTPSPDQEIHAASRLALSIPHPHIIDFVLAARGANINDQEISAELIKAGWSQEEITQALNHQEKNIG